MIDFDIRPSGRTRCPTPSARRCCAAPGFGQLFTDHMITLRWSAERGWHDGRLEPYGPFTLDPATAVFHYSQEFFEGLKAYRQDNGSIAMFRPDANAARFNRSARRMAMPELPEETFVRALELLVAQDRDWVPVRRGEQPVPAAVHDRDPARPRRQPPVERVPVLRHRLARRVLLQRRGQAGHGVAVRGLHPGRPGGTGAVKAGGNYAAAFVAQQQAVDRGCDQVVWLDAAEHRWVEEMGGMNLFFVSGSGAGGQGPQIMTPALTGTLLPGITRDSLLRLAPELGIKATEDRISIEGWQAQCASGELTEVFACGTAAVITPVGRVKGESAEWLVADGEPGPVTMRLREELIAIQYGRNPDPFNWVHKVC